MNALVRKEIRSLLPVWAAALALVIVPELLVWIAKHNQAAPPDPVLFWFFGFAVLLLSLASFGQEFNAGTFSILLAQPIPRVRIWRVKVTVLAVALASVALVFLVGFWSRPFVVGPDTKTLFTYFILIWVLMVLCGMSGALWSTLLLRQVGLAFGAAVVTPGLVCMLVAALTKDEGPLVFNMSFALLGYAIAGFVLARQMFLRVQDIQLSSGNLPAPSLTKLLGVSLAGRKSPLRTLILKEIQFHHVSLLLAPCAYVLYAAFIIVQTASHPEKAGGMKPLPVTLMILSIILWGAIPFLLGSIAVAEERKLGTLESHLCLPISRRVQFAVKLVVTVLLSVLLCAVVPFLIDSAGRLIGWHDGPFASPHAFEGLGYASMIVAAVTALSFYASTFTRNTLQAMFHAIIGSMMVTSLILWCIHPRVVFLGQSAGYGPLFGCIGGPLLGVTVLRLAFGNYGHNLVGMKLWWRNAFTMLAVFTVSLTATALTYHRTWELLMNLEPPHGPARLSGAIRPKIIRFGSKIFVLLPDGRLWVSKHSREIPLYKFIEAGKTEDANTTVPLDGEFLGDKWLCIESRYAAPVAVQPDGSLWKIGLNRTHTDGTPELKRVGSDTDWKTAAVGGGFYLAVKTDGTLWGWGDNKYGALGSGPAADWETLRQIGTDTDWDSVGAEYNVAIGFKRDGSVWKWGQLQFGPRGELYDSREQSHSKPVRWNLNASNWVARAGGANWDVVVRRDGTMWASVPPPLEILGMSAPMDANSTFWRVGTESNWANVEMGGYQMMALRKNGSFVENDLYRPRLSYVHFSTWQPSKYSDWIAVAPEWSEITMALAADGTLSCWFRGSDSDNAKEFLGPTRKPIWSLNLLENSK